jgi:hypothetical protein
VLFYLFNRIFVGARRAGSDFFALGAFGTSDTALQITNDRFKGYSSNGIYWYNHPNFSFGFAPESAIYLNSSDILFKNSSFRLSWAYDESPSRVGLAYPSGNYFKEIYYLTFPTGIISDDQIGVSDLLDMGFELCYEAAYSSVSYTHDLYNCNGNNTWLVFLLSDAFRLM